MAPASSAHGTKPHATNAGPRSTRACEQCRLRKVKCDGQQPCSACIRHHADCVFRAQEARGRKRKASPSQRTAPNIRPRPPSEPLRSTTPPPAPSSEALLDPELYKIHQELRTGIGVRNVQTGAFQFYGPSSHFCFVQRIYQRMYRAGHEGLLGHWKKHAIPHGLQRWGLESFMFPLEEEAYQQQYSPERHFSRELGDSLIETYFRTAHPQLPVLAHSEMLEAWARFWDPPGRQQDRRGSAAARLVYMVMAIGARMVESGGQEHAAQMEQWAEYFSNRAKLPCALFHDPCLPGTHLLLLKAMYALQAMRPNDAYLYLGHAARSALSLGINKAQVSDGPHTGAHRLRITFWATYAFERLCALYTGRPSAFHDDQIDAAQPEDLVAAPGTGADAAEAGPTTDLAYLRALAELGGLADRIARKVYSPRQLRSVGDLARVVDATAACDAALERLARSLPAHLRFAADGEAAAPAQMEQRAAWQEVQRAHLGLNYYQLRMLLHRPTLVYASLFASRAAARASAAGMGAAGGDGASWDLRRSTDVSVSAAKRLIAMADDVVCGGRVAGGLHDGGVAFFLVSACVTLLYDALDPETNVAYARESFVAVERGVLCLDRMNTVGPLTGKAVSVDVMHVAQDALMCRGEDFESQEETGLTDLFPWVNNDEITATDGGVFDFLLPDPLFCLEDAGQQDPELETNFQLGSSTNLYFNSPWLSSGLRLEDKPS